MVIAVSRAQPDVHTRTVTLADGRVMVTRRVHATADEVWTVLADGGRYAAWAPGISRVRQVDPGWPRVGSQVHHDVGSWPFLLDGRTEVVACEPGRQLVLWSAGPVAAARLRIMVTEARTHGCVVRIAHDGPGGVTRLLPRVLRDRVAGPAHRETARRLAVLAEGQHAEPWQRIGRSADRLPEPAARRIS